NLRDSMKMTAMNRHHPVGHSGRIVLATSAAAFVFALTAHAQFNITSGTGNTGQNFDTLITTGTNQPWANDTTLTIGDSTLDGWSLFNGVASGTPITTYNSGTGSSNTGNFYSFGAAAATERALGGVASGGAYFGSPATGAVAGWI